MKQTMLLCLLLVQQMTCSAQRISYTYDEAGNRLLKKVVITAKLMSVSTFLDEEDAEDEKTIPSATDIKSTLQNDSCLIVSNDKGCIQLRLPKNESSSIQLVTIGGRPILSKTVEVENYMMDLSNYQQGVYMLIVKTGKLKKTWKINKR